MTIHNLGAAGSPARPDAACSTPRRASVLAAASTDFAPSFSTMTVGIAPSIFDTCSRGSVANFDVRGSSGMIGDGSGGT